MDELCHEDFFDVKDLAEQIGLKTNIRNIRGEVVRSESINGEQTKWAKAYCYKYSYYEKQFSVMNISSGRHSKKDLISVILGKEYK